MGDMKRLFFMEHIMFWDTRETYAELMNASQYSTFWLIGGLNLWRIEKNVEVCLKRIKNFTSRVFPNFALYILGRLLYDL